MIDVGKTILARNLGPLETTHEIPYTEWWRLSEEEKAEYVASVKAALLVEVQKRHPDRLYAFGEPKIEMPQGGLTVSGDRTLQRMVRITCHVFVFEPLLQGDIVSEAPAQSEAACGMPTHNLKALEPNPRKLGFIGWCSCGAGLPGNTHREVYAAHEAHWALERKTKPKDQSN